MPLLAFLFVVVPLVELYLLLQVGQVLGLGATVGLVLVTGLLGAALARQQGAAVLRKLEAAAASGEGVGQTLAEGALVLVAGVLLLTPGVLTDAVGLALLIPPVRRRVAPALARRFVRRAQASAHVHVQSFLHRGGPLGGQLGGGPWGPAAPSPSEEVIDVPVEVRDVPQGSDRPA
ncbi:MAG: FxsA family protein [Planctomycetes bacterium]|nr:FxsA family protein [Planctomycetota bacterium]